MSAPPKHGSAGQWLAISASVVVVATIVAAIAVMGTPGEQREARLDRKRVHDLGQIARAIRAYHVQHDVLPHNLAELTRHGRRLSIVDPVDGSPYSYEATGKKTFRLCAVFATDTAQTLDDADNWGEEWSHGVGRRCFDLNTKREA